MKKPIFMRVTAVLTGAALVLCLGLRVAAPQIFVLKNEGFPAPLWPAPGVFATVDGPVSAVPLIGAVSEAAQARFHDSKGRALLVNRYGEVAGLYGPGITPETRLNSYSLVKSLVGVLVLKAVSDGHISGLDMPLRAVLGPEVPDITLDEALRMTSGLVLEGEPPKDEKTAPLDDADFSPFAPVAQMHAYGIQNILPRLQIDPARRGTFHYQSANTALLGLVVEAAYDRPLPQILSDLIWSPAGAAPAQWRMTPEGQGVSAYCCLYARPYDWLLVGRFLLRNGDKDAPFLREDLWHSWILPDLSAEARGQGVYAWQIRHDILDRAGEGVQGPFAYMLGHGGQMVYLLPSLDAVVVRFGAQPQLLHSTLYGLFPDG
jgi:CubicO group peptidase (beta-lactamase class C family)